MPLQPDDFKALAAIAKRYVLTRDQVHRICFDEALSGRSIRKRLQRLRTSNYLTRHRVPVALPDTNGAAPVYYMTKPGCEALAAYFDDERFIATNTRTPRADRLAHWIAINDTRIVIEQAIARQSEVQLDGWITEWEVINKDAAKDNQFVLHAQLCADPPLSCSPDAAFRALGAWRKKSLLPRSRTSANFIAAPDCSPQIERLRRPRQRTSFTGSTFRTRTLDRVFCAPRHQLRTTAVPRQPTAMRKQPRRGDLWLYVNKKQLNPSDVIPTRANRDEPRTVNSDRSSNPSIVSQRFLMVLFATHQPTCGRSELRPSGYNACCVWTLIFRMQHCVGCHISFPILLWQTQTPKPTSP